MIRVVSYAEMTVTEKDFARLLAGIEALPLAQLVALDAAIRGRLNRGHEPTEASADPVARGTPAAEGLASIADIEARFAVAPLCPHCQSAEVSKWGTANGLKRYQCKVCVVTFNALTGTPLAQLHKRELWIGNAQAMVEGISLRKVAARLDIGLETAFRWRHRFLQAPKAVKPKLLEGTVETDETYFLQSQKGSRKLARPARKRGGSAKKRGLSDEQVPVLIARDRNKATTDEILPDRSERSITAVLEPVVDKAAVLVSDGAHSTRAFADHFGIAHIALNLSAGQHSWGIYHIQNVNNYGSRLKGWMRRFNGVATKYLDSYLGWHRTDDRQAGTLNANIMLAAAWG